MKNLTRARRTIGTVLLLLFAHLLLPVSALAEDSKPASADKLPLQIHKKFLRETTFSYQGGPRQKISNFGGLSFTDEFSAVMSQNPAALREAKKSHLYAGIALVGAAGCLVSAAIELVGSIKDASAVQAGHMPDMGVKSSEVVLPMVSASVVLISGLIAAKHISEGIRLFNESELNQTLMPGEEPITVDKSLYIDLLIGLNSASLKHDPETGIAGRNGFITGLLIDLHGSGSGSWQTGFLFSTKGDALQRLSYLKCPVHYKYNFGNGRVRPYLFAGPSMNALVSSSTESNGLDLTGRSTIDENPFPLDLALNFGGGLRLAKTPFSLSVMHSRGLINPYTDDPVGSAKNRSTYFYAAYGF